MDDQEETEEEQTTTPITRFLRGARLGEEKLDEKVSLTGVSDDTSRPPTAKLTKGDEYDSIPDLADLEMATQYHIIDRNFRRRECLMKCVVVLSVLLVVVGVSLGVALGISSHYTSSAAAAAASAAIASVASSINKGTVVVPPPPIDLSALCDASNVLGDEGRRRCKEACAPAACCSSTLENCMMTNEETCAAYSACLLEPIDVTNGLPTVSEAEQVITTLCEDTADSESVKQCQRLCDSRACCFNDQYSGYICYDDLKEWCDEYKICSSLTNVEQSKPTLPEPTVAPSGPLAQSIQPTEPEAFDVNSFAVDSNVTKIEQVCSMDAINVNGTKECTDLCRERACCFVEESEFNCIQERSDWCFEYSLCTILNMEGATLATTPAAENATEPNAVESACSLDNIAANGKFQCEDVCERGRCCFIEDETSCAITLEEWCYGYLVCTNLIDPSVSNETIATDVVMEMDLTVNATNAWDIAFANETIEEVNATNVSDIAFVDETIEVVSATDIPFVDETIEAVIATNISDVELLDNNTTDLTNIPMEEPVATPPTAVDAACASAAIAAKGRAECEFQCSKRACCFIMGVSNCFATSPDWCYEYAACSILTGSHGVEMVGSPIFNSTIASNSPTQVPIRAPALASIYGSMGAATDAPSAQVPVSIETATTASGSSDAGLSPNSTTSIIDAACSADAIASEGKGECEDICELRACCFIEGNFNCYAEQMEWCDEYSACNVLNEKPITTVTNVPTKAPTLASIDGAPSTQVPASMETATTANAPVSLETTTNAPTTLTPAASYYGTEAATTSAPTQVFPTTESIYEALESENIPPTMAPF